MRERKNQKEREREKDEQKKREREGERAVGLCIVKYFDDRLRFLAREWFQ